MERLDIAMSPHHNLQGGLTKDGLLIFLKILKLKYNYVIFPITISTSNSSISLYLYSFSKLWLLAS